jgi:hypothetical protein
MDIEEICLEDVEWAVLAQDMDKWVGVVNAVMIPASWVTSSRCVFLNKVLIIRPNTTYISGTIVCYCTLQHVSTVQMGQHQLDVGYTKS